MSLSTSNSFNPPTFQELFLSSDSPDRPTQIKFFRPAQMALFARLTTYPPLSQVTVIPPSRNELNFTVTLESSTSLPERPWEVSIWYDHGSFQAQKGPWQALDLQRVDQGPYSLYHDTNSNSKTYSYTFTGNLASPFTSTDKIYRGRRVPFTVRYRVDSNSEWMWVFHNHGIGDGELLLQPPVDPNFLTASPVDLRDGWVLRKLTSEAPDARLYSIDSSHPIPPTQEGNAPTERKVLGRVLQPCRWFALVRIWSPWLAPRQGDQDFHLTEPAILLSFLRSDGLNVVLLAINGVDDALTTFASTFEGEIEIHMRNDGTKDRKFRLLAASAWSFEVANAAVMYEARKLVRQSAAHIESASRLPKEIEAQSVDSDTVLVSNNKGSQEDAGPTPQWLETWYDSLAYCTWNSLGQDLNAEKIMNGLDSLAKNKIHIATLIIDDNWQTLSGVQGENQFHRGWKEFEANPLGFPEGLKKAVEKIRAAHPQIRDIAVWHALMGYWGGIAHDGKIAKEYATVPVNIQSKSPAGGTKIAVAPSDIHRMYNDFYSFLSSCGVTGVKTDVQFMLDEMTSTTQRREFINTYQSAWTQAHLTHLAGRAISCMSMIPQILHHSFLPTNTPRILLRNSDDFFPNVPSSHPWHIFANAHNAVFVQHLNVLPDWDMFQTSHEYSGFHAAARCVSGGPIYITDSPGEHDVSLIHQMTALNPRGQTVILRPTNVGKTIDVYDKYDSRGVLKVGVYDGRAEVGTGLLGLFNLDEKDCKFSIPLTHFPGVVVADTSKGELQKKWLVRSHMTGKITHPITPSVPKKPHNLLQGQLGIRGYDIWSAYPVREIELGLDSRTEVSVLGLLGKMAGACAILESKFTFSGNGSRLKVNIKLKALGTLGLWISDAQKRKVDDLMVLIQGKPIPAEKVRISSEGVEGTEAGVIEVDVLGAWEEMKLEAGWNNEVGIEILLG